MSNSGHGKGIKTYAMHLPRDLFFQVYEALNEGDAAKRNEAAIALGLAAPLGWSTPDEESGDDRAT